ncbi:hypothetical protein T484DRAFT_1846773 [Baffinella frigidus]|nr:hypothetical protein T484DRAFT_1846773 [Cryptophyta sp. CCMP2293]
MCDNLIDSELEEAVEAAVEEGWVLMASQEERSVEDFNDDNEYSKMLEESVQVKVMVARKADALIEAGGEGGELARLRGVPLDAFSTVYSFWAALAGYTGPKWERLITKTDNDEVLSLRDATGNTVMHWAVSDDSRAKLAEVIASRKAGRVPDVKNKSGITPLHLVRCPVGSREDGAGAAAGAGKDAANKEADTPLHLVARSVQKGKDKEAVSRALLAFGADKDATNTAGDTTRQVAEKGGHTALLVALLS